MKTYPTVRPWLSAQALDSIIAAARSRAGETGMLLRELSTRVSAPPPQHWQREALWRDTKILLATLAPGDNDGHLYSRSEFFRKPIPPASLSASTPAQSARGSVGPPPSTHRIAPHAPFLMSSPGSPSKTLATYTPPKGRCFQADGITDL